MIKRAHIRQFLAVVDEGSFTHAAARLRVTQPTLSTGVAELERLIGSSLFLRERRKLRLTEAGGRFLPIARDLDRGFRMADSFGQNADVRDTDLKIGVIPTWPLPHLRLLVEHLNQRFSVELLEGSDPELRAAVASGRAQMALTLLRHAELGDHIFPVVEEPYVMLAHRDHPLSGADAVAPESLAAEMMIARRSCEWLDGTSRFFAQRGVRPRFALKSHHDDRCLAMVSAGLGITTAPLSLARDDMAIIKVQGYEFSRRIGVLVEAAFLRSAETAAFVQQALDSASHALPRR
jgi:DNA-binding transcriptional LysR family regulator